jgi:hypothetical protein
MAVTKMKTIKLTKRERFMDANPDMLFTDMATQLNLSLSAIERTYDRLQKKRANAFKCGVYKEYHPK